MPSIVRLSKRELDELIESVEAEGGDTTEFKKLRAEFTEVQPQKPARQQALSVVSREEETTEERLNREELATFSPAVSQVTYWLCVLSMMRSTT